MRKQQQIWEKEHTDGYKALPSLSTPEPSSGVVTFVSFLQAHGVTAGTAIDIGCGKGRNTVYLAQHGFTVYGLDYIPAAVAQTKQLSNHLGLANRVHVCEAAMDEPWPFADAFFDVAVDYYSSIDIETKRGRIVYKDELYRTLKPGGYALVAVVSVDDEWEKELIQTSPGREKNSTIWPQNGKFQKDYDERELRAFYKEFRIVALEKLQKKQFKLDKPYLATNFWLVLQKPVG